MRPTTIAVSCVLLLAAALPASGQDSIAARPVDLAAALSPGARVRLHIPYGRTTVGLLMRRNGDTLAIAPEKLMGLGAEFVVRLQDAKGLQVSAGYEPGFRSSSVLHWAVGGAALAGALTVGLLGDESNFRIVGVRALAGGILFAMGAPRGRPVERWVPVQVR